MKTIEEIAKGEIDKYIKVPIESISPKEEAMYVSSAIQATVNAIKEAQRWIDVEEELPPVNELVIAKYRNYEDEKILLLTYQGDEAELGYVCEWRPIELK